MPLCSTVSRFFIAGALACVTGAVCAAGPDGDALVQGFAADVVRSGDAAGMAFAVLDKPSATVTIFDAKGQLVARSPVLLGQAVGDVAPPDIGTRPLSKVKPNEKVTSAGRFVTEAGRNHTGEDIVWLDYQQALSMHRVRNVRGENRPQRLASPTVADNRISYGCVNMPLSFYDRYIDPLFGKQKGVVYVLPETQPLAALFPFTRTGSAALAGAEGAALVGTPAAAPTSPR